MLNVVGGIVIRDEKVLLCQRREGGKRSLKWEFPGGKLEKGESPQKALERELHEELDIETKAERVFDVLYEKETDILLLFYFAKIVSGEIKKVECNDFVFCEPGKLLSYDLAPTDRLLAEKLVNALSSRK